MTMMTYEEYSQTIHRPPYFFKIAKSGQLIYYCGERHTNDPKHPEWVQIKKFWDEFVQETKNKHRLVFIEGGKPPIKETADSAILKFGGPGFISFLAHEHSVNIESPEIQLVDLIEKLQLQFTHEQIVYYFFATDVAQWNRYIDPKPDFDAWMQSRLDSDKKKLQWDDIDFSVQGMKTIHEQLFQIPFDKNDELFFRKNVNPVKVQGVINQVSQAAGRIRDEYVVTKTVEYFKQGYSIYIQFGMTHAVMQEPYLKELIEGI